MIMKVPIVESFPRIQFNLKVRNFCAIARYNGGKFVLIKRYFTPSSMRDITVVICLKDNKARVNSNSGHAYIFFTMCKPLKTLFCHFWNLIFPILKRLLQKVLWKNNPFLWKFFRDRHRRCYLKKGVTKNLVKFTAKLLCHFRISYRSLFALLIIISVAFYNDRYIKMVNSVFRAILNKNILVLTTDSLVFEF